ncbi:hypothetical protein A4X06_0g5721 [Tilletia controversa]|uniref:triacylglycerol lipase n=1 Tax=Tilletia controversa TaxID=13291 RepID=A0A8X7MR82_9BASI|nr:hypothetical protein A4X06_0g5721 [Tilletia controversa]
MAATTVAVRLPASSASASFSNSPSPLEAARAATDRSTRYDQLTALTSGTKSPASFGLTFTNQGLDGSLKNGYHVVVPDHEGSKAASFVGPVEGHAVLDGLLAATSFPDAIPGVSRRTPIAIGGYSGGAHATAWATQLYKSYAPSLNIKGQVIGGTPVNLTNTLLFLNKGIYAGFALAGVMGEYLVYPELKQYIDDNIYPNGTALFKDFMDNNFSYFKIPNALDDPIAKKRLGENLLGNDGKKLPIPTIMFHGDADDVIPYQDAVDYAKSQCAKGAQVHFYSDAGK